MTTNSSSSATRFNNFKFTGTQILGMYDNEFSLGPVPAEESCQQVGRPDYSPVRARQECKRHIELLRKKFGDEPEGARLKIKPNDHDYGIYYDCVVQYDGNNRTAAEYAARLESNGPRRWEE